MKANEKMTREQVLHIAKPILFNTKMVQAIQDGTKTVTRRVIKGVPETAHKFLGINQETQKAEFLCGILLRTTKNMVEEQEKKVLFIGAMVLFGLKTFKMKKTVVYLGRL